VGKRVIALGASNLTRGLRTVVSLSRQAWGADSEVIAALGLGRSYGARHRLLIRALPGILDCGLWRRLDELPPMPSVGIVSDVGNDILYGCSSEQILAWVHEAVTRLQRHTSEIAITGLPSGTVEHLKAWEFTIIRTFMFPSSRQSLHAARDTAARVHDGIERMARDRGLRFVPLRAEWYGIDPIHFRYPFWRRAWGECLGLDQAVRDAAPEPGELAETLRMWLRADEHRWLFGMHQHTPQRGTIQLF
jgi:hypothetical protein